MHAASCAGYAADAAYSDDYTAYIANSAQSAVHAAAADSDAARLEEIEIQRKMFIKFCEDD